MAGEIQLNSITMATESSGSITAELDTIRPNTTNGSLTLQGDSSGSGVTGITIDSSGTTTLGSNLVIPNSGTIGSASDTDAITISSTGKVTTADSELNVKTTSQTFTVKGVDEAIGDSQSGTAPDTTDSDSGQIAVYNGSTKLLGITEHGYVLKPYQPAFIAYATETSTFTGPTTVVYQNTYLNRGSIYNTSTGRFTAPVNGVYQVNYAVRSETSRAYARTRLYKNGANYTIMEAGVDNQSGSSHYQYSTMINLSAGDYVEFVVDSGYTLECDTLSQFSAFLVG